LRPAIFAIYQIIVELVEPFRGKWKIAFCPEGFDNVLCKSAASVLVYQAQSDRRTYTSYSGLFYAHFQSNNSYLLFFDMPVFPAGSYVSRLASKQEGDDAYQASF
jgi:hypothetical protein